MPELGKYAAEVLSAYAAALGLMVLLVVVVMVRARAIRRRLDAAEKEMKNG